MESRAQRMGKCLSNGGWLRLFKEMIMAVKFKESTSIDPDGQFQRFRTAEYLMSRGVKNPEILYGISTSSWLEVTWGDEKEFHKGPKRSIWSHSNICVTLRHQN
jgi:hypothetical protein